MTSLSRVIDPSTTPVAPPPPGITSNFVNPESLANTILRIGIFMLVSTALVVFVRLHANYHTTRGLDWDDCSCVIATLIFLIYVVASLEMRDFARHAYDLPVIWFTASYFKKVFVANITAGPMLFFAKSSLFMLYYRVFEPQKFTRRAIIFGIISSFVVYFCYLIASIVMCAPKVGHPWNSTVAAKCTQANEIRGFVLGITNLAIDIFLLILPIPIVLALELPVKKKMGIFAVFMVGSSAFVASIYSLVYRTKLRQGKDSNWNCYICMICTMIETGVTIMCSSTSALVIFWKSHIATNVPLLYSRLRFRYRELTIRFKFVSRASSQTQIYSESDQFKSYRNLYNLNYAGLNGSHPDFTGISDSIVRTEIGGGSPISEVEKGVIRKTMKVEQSYG